MRCPATACCSRRWPRCWACGWWVRSRCSPPALLFERLALAAYGPRARWGAAGSSWRPSGTSGSGGSRSLSGSPSRSRRRSRSRAGAALLGGGARGPVRGREPGRGRAARAGGRHARALAALAPRRRARDGPPAGVLVLALALLFPEGGYEPYPILLLRGDRGGRAGVSVGAAAARSGCCGRGRSLYLLVCVLCLVDPHADGQQRRALRGAACRAAAAVRVAGGAGAPPAAPRRRHRGARRGAARAGGALACARSRSGWLWGPVRETLAVAGSEATERLLLRAGRALPGRPAAPASRCGWRCRSRARTGRRRCWRRRVSLARGWEKQLDTRYDRVLLASGLTRAAYDRWLRWQAVSYVALPDAPLDPSSAQEGRLIRARPAVPAGGVREQALAHLPRARAHAPGLRSRAADVAGPRLLRAAGVRPRGLPGAGALHPLLDACKGERLRAVGARRVDVGDGPRPGPGGRRRPLLARARARGGWLLQTGESDQVIVAHEEAASRDRDRDRRPSPRPFMASWPRPRSTKLGGRH